MNLKSKIMQGVSLVLLTIITVIVVRNIFKTILVLHPKGFRLFYHIALGLGFIIYTFIYGYYYHRMWEGRLIRPFHIVNANLTGLLSALTFLLILIFINSIFTLIYLVPILLPSLFIFITSLVYLKSYK